MSASVRAEARSLDKNNGLDVGMREVEEEGEGEGERARRPKQARGSRMRSQEAS